MNVIARKLATTVVTVGMLISALTGCTIVG